MGVNMCCDRKNCINVKGSIIGSINPEKNKEINNNSDNNNNYNHSSTDTFGKGAENDKYTLLSKEGEGNFGKVSRIIEYNNNKEYAVKTIDIDDSVKKKTGYQEYKILSHCHHPNIVSHRTTFKQTKSSKTLNIVIEYVNGGSLQKKLDDQLTKNKEYDEKSLIFWLFQICIGLSYLHKKKIIHRDIKPDNILLTKNGLIKIVDLGLAKQYKSEKQLERKNTRAGTPNYMSYEMRYTQIYDKKTDLYSLGLTFKQFIDNKTYDEEFVNLINSLCEKNRKKRPTADDILEKPIIIKGMKKFLEEYKYEESLAKLIMEKLNKNKDNEKDDDDSFISKIKRVRKALIKEKSPYYDDKNKKDLDILMSIIVSKIQNKKN